MLFKQNATRIAAQHALYRLLPIVVKDYCASGSHLESTQEKVKKARMAPTRLAQALHLAHPEVVATLPVVVVVKVPPMEFCSVTEFTTEVTVIVIL